MPPPAPTRLLGEHADNAIGESDLLFDDFAQHGLSTLELLSRSGGVLVSLTEAGKDTADLSKRNELEEHVRYWRSIRRVLTGAWEESTVFDFEPVIDASIPSAIFSQLAYAPTGLTDRVIEDFEVDLSENDSPFTAENCRLLRGHLSGLLDRRLSLKRSSLIDVRFDRVHVRSMDLAQTRSFACRIDVSAEQTIVMKQAIAWATRLSIRARQFVADDSDFAPLVGRQVDGGFLDLVRGAMRPRWVQAQKRRAVSFVDCDIGRAGFRGALLQGVRFERCTFGSVSFAGAQLTGSEFVGCTFPVGCLTRSQRSQVLLDRCTFRRTRRPHS